MSPAAQGRLCVLAAAAMWSIGGLMIRQATEVWGVHFAAVACLRSVFAGLVFVWAIPAARPGFGGRFALSVLLYTGILGCFVASTALTTAAHGVLIQYIYPLLVAVAARLMYREAISRRGWSAVGIGAAGIGVILYESIGLLEPVGLTFAFSSAIFFAAFVLAQRGMTKGSPIGLAGAYNLLAAALLLPFAWGRFDLDAKQWAWMAAMGVFQIGVPYVLFLTGLRRIGATEAAILTLLEPVLNPVWVALWLGEIPSAFTIAGGAVLLVAVGLRLSEKTPTGGAAG